MSLKRIIAPMLAMIILLSVFSACNKQEPTEDTGFVPALDTQQTASFEILGMMGNFEALDAVVAEFQKYYPNVTINYSKLDYFTEMINTRIAADPTVGLFLSYRRYDVPEFKLVPQDYNQQFSQNRVTLDSTVDLANLDLDLSCISPETLEKCMINGKMAYLPLFYNVYGLMVNEDLFEREGLSVPTNEAEFYEVCDALVQKGYVPIQQQEWFLQRALFANYIWGQFADAENSETAYRAFRNGEVGSAEIMRPVFELFDTMMDKGYISTESFADYPDDYDSAILNFFEGDVPMLVVDSPTVSGMQKRESKSEAFKSNPFEYSFCYSPLAKDGFYAHKEIWYGISMNSNCANPELVAEFLRFLFRSESLNMLGEIKGMPSVALDSKDERFTELWNVNGITTYEWDFEGQGNITLDLFRLAIEKYAYGSYQAIDEAIAEMESVMAELKQ